METINWNAFQIHCDTTANEGKKCRIICLVKINTYILFCRHADSVLQHELKQTGVPINQINEAEGDEEYWGHDIKGVYLDFF